MMNLFLQKHKRINVDGFLVDVKIVSSFFSFFQCIKINKNWLCLEVPNGYKILLF